jgi:hypothetical protein
MRRPTMMAGMVFGEYCLMVKIFTAEYAEKGCIQVLIFKIKTSAISAMNKLYSAGQKNARE